MSDANRTKSSLIAEVTAGTTPSTPTMLVIPKASFAVRPSVSYRESDIIRDDANVQRVQKVSEAVTGGLTTELVYAPSGDAIHSLMQAAMRTTESASPTQSTGVACTSGVLSSGTPDVETGIEVGDVIRVRTSGNVLVGYYKVTARNTGTHTITAPGVADGTGYKIDRGGRMANGTTDTNFSIEHARLDASLYEIFRGIGVGSMGISIADEQISKLTFGFEGLSSARGSSAYASGYTTPTDRDSMVATSVPVLKIAGTTYEMTDLSVNIDNRLAARRKVGTSGPTSLRRGSFRLTGTLNLYLDSWAELTKHADGTESDLWFVQQDAAGNALSFSIPKLKWTDGMTETRGRDQDDFAKLTFQAELSSESISARLQRWAA